MAINLRDFANKNQISYSTAWRLWNNGQLQGQKTPKGIFIEDNPVSMADAVAQDAQTSRFVIPQSEQLFETSTAATRGNKSANEDVPYRFSNIENGIIPFNVCSYGGNNFVSIRDSVILTQKCYYNFAIYQNVVNLMTEFSTGKVYLTGGNATSRKFFDSFFKAIHLNSFVEGFFRELFRSGNVFIYAHKKNFTKQDLTKLTQLYSLNLSAKTSLPVKYTIINPADVLIGGSSDFIKPTFFKKLNAYEIESLKNPKTKQEVEFVKSLPEEVKKQIKSGAGEVIYPVQSSLLTYVPYNKQDYEPFAVPFGYCVLDDINRKEELKKMDAQICRTMQQVVLLVKTGYEGKNGEYNVNQKSITALQEIFKNESVGRVLVADFTTDAKFVIPEIGDVLDPKKYEVLDRDIAIGLNNIISGGAGGEKFANKSVSVDIFIERLRQARDKFIDEFLQPQIDAISEELGFKSVPQAEFAPINLSSEMEYARIYQRLGELGILTPMETLTALQTNKLPSAEESLENQKEFKKLKDEGLYEPITGRKTDLAQEVGRPDGTPAPQTPKKISPIGKNKANYSLKKVVANLKLAEELTEKMRSELKTKFKIKKLNKEQEKLADDLANVIITNEAAETWNSKIKDYVNNPLDKNPETVSKIQDLAADFGLDIFTASVLYWSQNA